MAKKLEGEISLKDNYTRVIQRAAKQTSAFRKDVEAAKKAIRQAEAEKKKAKDLKIKAYLDKTGLSKIANQLKPLKNTYIKMQARYEVAMSKIKKVKEFAQKPIELAIKARDMASPVINRIKTGIKTLAVAAAAIAIAGAGAGFKGASDLERQQISMQHFIGVNNKGMSQAGVKQQSDAYLAWLRNNANITPFDTGEVVQAGSRALGVTGGSVKQSQDLVRLAEDMAALTPGKTVMDAMEAIADMKMGEYERMKEFGFKVTKDMADQAGGIQQLMKKQIAPYFKGGAEKLSGSMFGQISTIRGVLETTLTDVFTAPLNRAKGSITQFANWLQANQQKITDFGIKVIDTVSNAIATAVPYIQQAVTMVTPLLQAWWAYIQNLINLIKPLMMQLWTGVIQPLFNWVVANMPAFQNAMGTVFAWLAPKLRDLIDVFSWLTQVWIENWPMISSILQTAWKVIAPIFDVLWAALKGVFDLLRLIYPLARVVINALWALFKPLSAMLTFILDKISKIMKFGGNIVREIVNALLVQSGDLKEGSAPKGFASGLPYVPKDNYPAMLHEGERVLTASENRRYNKGEGGSVTIAKLADTIIVREEADIDKIASRLASKLKETKLNYAGA